MADPAFPAFASTAIGAGSSILKTRRSGAFTVWVTKSDGAKLTRLVDESGSSEGRYWLDSSSAARLEVTAGGAWTIEVADSGQGIAASALG